MQQPAHAVRSFATAAARRPSLLDSTAAATGRLSHPPSTASLSLLADDSPHPATNQHHAPADVAVDVALPATHSLLLHPHHPPSAASSSDAWLASAQTVVDPADADVDDRSSGTEHAAPSSLPEHRPLHPKRHSGSSSSTSTTPRPLPAMKPSHGSAGSAPCLRVFFTATLLAVAAAMVLLNLVLYDVGGLRKSLLGDWKPPAPGSWGGNSTTKPDLGRDPTNNRRQLLLNATAKGAFFGVSLDWEAKDTPAKFNARFGKRAAVFQHFMDMDTALQRVDELKFIVDAILQVDGALLALTVVPVSVRGMDGISEPGWDQLGRVMAEINRQGVPVLLRFAHEMNGNWYAYGQKPAAYKRGFVKCAQAVRAKGANHTYMVWAPNTNAGYPFFEPGDAKAPTPGSDDFRALDTNRDGAITQADDPYTPFYPGDEWVDWIGYSLFHFGGAGLTTNALPDAQAFIAGIEDTQNPAKPGFNIYRDFAQARNKPFAIMETAAAYHPENLRANDPEELPMKRAWWRQVFSDATLKRYPLLKLICWFDIAKRESVNGGLPTAPAAGTDLRNFRMSWDANVRDAFKADLPANIFFADTPENLL
ncbi:hypothetical protein H9P43_007395 [Blastocladiella emersonii ATCC 22665]|nr:hypothetical protein H9P43_007395 [Blastocladiella emersonii ATCC 22665]